MSVLGSVGGLCEYVGKCGKFVPESCGNLKAQPQLGGNECEWTYAGMCMRDVSESVVVGRIKCMPGVQVKGAP